MDRAESSLVISRRGVPAFAGNDEPTVVWLRGEHDIATVADLTATMAEAIALDDANIIIDLSAVEFMGAATVGVILRSQDSLRQASRTLSLRSPSRCAGRVLDICGIAYRRDSSPGDISRATDFHALESWVAVPRSERARHT